MRKFLAVVAAMTLAVSACDKPSENDADQPVATTPAPTASSMDKSLDDILIEAGYSPKEFRLNPSKTDAIITFPGICPIEVALWMEDSYKIMRVGDRVLSDLSDKLNRDLSGPSPRAEVVEKALAAAGKLPC